MQYTDKIRGNDGKIRAVAPNEFIPRKDLRRLRFGRLFVLDFDHKGGTDGRTYYYKCKCDCGNECIKSSGYLLDSKYAPHKSCGCWHRELSIKASTTHGHGQRGKSPTYKAWCEMKARCLNPNNHNYHNYGGRGIKVCERWLNSFENFLSDMGERPSKEYSIDRIDFNGDYCPENCRWATTDIQCNNRRNNIHITYQGEIMTLKQWCDRFDMIYANVRAVYNRHKYSFEEIVSMYKNKGHQARLRKIHS